MTVSGNDVYTQSVTVNDFSSDINKKIDSYIQKYISDETERFEEYKTAFLKQAVQRKNGQKENLILLWIMK